MRPDNYDIIMSRRREGAATFAGTMVDVEALVELEPPCVWIHHDTGESGCEPGAPGEFVIRVREHCGPPMPTIFIICQAQHNRIRAIRHHDFECVTCGRPTTMAALVDFLGRVEEYYH